MNLLNEFLMRINNDYEHFYYLRLTDYRGIAKYRLWESQYTDEEAEAKGEFPYWDVKLVEQYIRAGIWLSEQDLTESVPDTAFDLEDVL